MTASERLEEARLRTLMDIRVQQRNSKRDSSHPSVLYMGVLVEQTKWLVNVIDNVELFDVQQPAIGQFDEDRLAYIQRNFHQYTKDK
jgi:hypothetical protein